MKRLFLPGSFLSIIFILILAGHVAADIPNYEEQFVYQVRAFNGRGYSESFVPRSEETIYLLSDVNNALFPRITLVYFWPLTGKFIAATKELNEQVEGKMEIIDSQGNIRVVEEVEFVLFYPNGIMGEEAELHVGKDAYGIFKKYESPMTDFYNRMNEYSKNMLTYRAQLMEYAAALEKRKERGDIISPDQVEADMPRQPNRPEQLPFDVTGLQRDYVINLHSGNYKLRFRAATGGIVEGSEKKIVVFAPRRAGGIGYEIIPGKRWTKKEFSNDPQDNIYCSGNNTLYFRPFIANEYNELCYNKLLDSQNKGISERWKWVHTDPMGKEKFVFSRSEESLEEIFNIPYFVKQISGSQLGYEILPFEKVQDSDKGPDFAGYEIRLSSNSNDRNHLFWLENQEGKRIAQSLRRIFILTREGTNWLYVVSAFPLLAGLLVYIRRKK